MKKIIFVLCLALLAAAACKKETPAPEAKEGIPMTISASIAPPPTRTVYTYNGISHAVAVNWEADEKLTVVSIGDAGITSVDEFTSTGEAGRDNAVFSGSYTGAEGDKVICLYPAISVSPSLYSGVEAGSTQIILNSPNTVMTSLANYPLDAEGYSAPVLKNCDAMIGDMTLSGGSASVVLRRQIVVFQFSFDDLSGGLMNESTDKENINKLNIAILETDSSNATTLATQCTLAATKSAYTGEFVRSAYGPVAFSCSVTPTTGPVKFFAPVLIDGDLLAGTTLNLSFDGRVRYSGMPWENSPGLRTYEYPFAETIPVVKGNLYYIHD